MEVLTLRGSAVTDRGPVRKTNEDAYFCDETLGLFVVADGMGGHAAGEVASNLSVESIASFIRRSHDDNEYSWPYGIDPQLSLNANRLRTAIHIANRRVYRVAEAHDDYTGMGTTVVAVLACDGHAVIAHIGDSRLYVFSDGTLTQVTQDDSWAATVLGHPSFADAASVAHHPMRNVLTNVLGAREQTDVHIQERRLSRGDCVMLCSDGLHSVLDAAAIAAILQEHQSGPDAAAALVQAAIAKGTRDNVTALVGRCEAV